MPIFEDAIIYTLPGEFYESDEECGKFPTSSDEESGIIPSSSSDEDFAAIPKTPTVCDTDEIKNDVEPDGHQNNAEPSLKDVVESNKNLEDAVKGLTSEVQRLSQAIQAVADVLLGKFANNNVDLFLIFF